MRERSSAGLSEPSGEARPPQSSSPGLTGIAGWPHQLHDACSLRELEAWPPWEAGKPAHACTLALLKVRLPRASGSVWPIPVEPMPSVPLRPPRLHCVHSAPPREKIATPLGHSWLQPMVLSKALLWAAPCPREKGGGHDVVTCVTLRYVQPHSVLTRCPGWFQRGAGAVLGWQPQEPGAAQRW